MPNILKGLRLAPIFNSGNASDPANYRYTSYVMANVEDFLNSTVISQWSLKIKRGLVSPEAIFMS